MHSTKKTQHKQPNFMGTYATDTQILGGQHVTAVLNKNSSVDDNSPEENCPKGVLMITTLLGKITIQYGKLNSNGNWTTDPWIASKFDGTLPGIMRTRIIELIQKMEYSHKCYGLVSYPKPDIIGLKISELLLSI